MPKGRLTVFCFGVLLLAGVAQTSQQQLYAVLPSRSVPKIPARVKGDVESYGNWEPSSADIVGLEEGLPHVSEMEIAGWPNLHIEHPDRYFRQYVGVSHRGKRQIYINAFCDDSPPPVGAITFMS